MACDFSEIAFEPICFMNNKTLMTADGADLPRPLRVLRKRLRALGLWSTAKGRGKASPDWGSLAEMGKAAPRALQHWFKPMDRYSAWRAVNVLTPAALSDLQQAIKAARPKVRFSIITPVYNTGAEHLHETVQSVLGQVYGDWELWLSDDASTNADTLRALDEVAGLDKRIRTLTSSQNGGISVATNAAAAKAKGDVLVFLDHDDLLTPDCLAELALYYTAHPDADIVYSDDDKLDDEGRFYAPQFKPDWSPALLTSFMYMSHVFTVRRSLFAELGGFRSDFDGSQDYDFALRASERARHVGHIPRVLYHWRAVAGSTAVSGEAKPHSFEAGRRAVQGHLDRVGVAGQVTHPDWAQAAKVGMFSIRFPDEGPWVTIIVPTYNAVDLLSVCLKSLELTTYRNYRVMVVDNDSDCPDTLAYLQSVSLEPHVSVERIAKSDGKFNYAALMNEAVACADGDLILFLNNDTKVIEPSWLSQMVGLAGFEGVGSVGARLRFADDHIQHAGIIQGYHDGLAGHAFRGLHASQWGYLGLMRAPHEQMAVTAACMLTPRALFQEMGGFDATTFAVAYNDADYGFRLHQAGYRNLYCPEAELYHFEGRTRAKVDDPSEVASMRKLYGRAVDPFHNPNLSLDDGLFQVAARRLPMRASRPVRVGVFSHNLRQEGAPKTLCDLIIGLASSGVIEPIIYAPADGPLGLVYAEAGIEVRLLPWPSPRSNLPDYIAAQSVLAMELRSAKCEVIVANTLIAHHVIGGAARAGLPSIWCQHESEPWYDYYSALEPAVQFHAYAAFAQAYAVTYVADATRLAWAPTQTRHNAVTIRHAIPASVLAEETSRWTRREARRRLGLHEDEVAVILPGTVCARKGQQDIVDAAFLLSAGALQQVKIFIAGALVEDEYAVRLAGMIESGHPAAAERIVLVGPVEDMSLYYTAADILVCTSRIESAPRILVEGMAFGLPIITTPVFGIPEVVEEGVNAIFYRPGDTKALAGHISALAIDSERRAVMADAGREVLESRPSYDDMIVKYAALVREAALSGSWKLTDDQY
ncbi:glycosyltransferase [Brevundimonas sp. RM1]